MPVMKLSPEFLYSHDFCPAKCHRALEKSGRYFRNVDVQLPRNGVVNHIHLRILDTELLIRLTHPLVVVHSSVFDRDLGTLLRHNPKVLELKMPRSFRTAYVHAFRKLDRVREIRLDNAQYVCSSAITECPNLRTIVTGASLLRCETAFFSSCSALERVVIQSTRERARIDTPLCQGLADLSHATLEIHSGPIEFGCNSLSTLRNLK